MTFTPPAPNTTRPTLRGSFGMAASTHWLASATAQSVLERGGNAFDAAVAGAFVLQVVEPHLNGPGGDLSAIYATADDPTPRVVSGQGPTPAGATIEHYRGEGLELVPGAGALAATVPGAVPSWLLLLETHGTWQLADCLAYAIGYARDGHPLLPSAVRTITAVQGLFERHWPTSLARWLPEGRLPAAGEIVRNEALARTLERLVEAGSAVEGTSEDARANRIRAALDAWQAGFVADEIEAFVATPHRHSTGGDHAGVLRAADMAAWVPAIEDAVAIEFRGVTVSKTGAWGQGPVLLQTLAILDTFDDDHLDPSTALGIHTITEALKLALADRDAYYGDPDVAAGESPVPLDVLLSGDYARVRARLIADRASCEFRPGGVPGRSPFIPPLVEEADVSAPAEGRAGTGEPTVRATAVVPPVDAGSSTEEAGSSTEAAGSPTEAAGSLTEAAGSSTEEAGSSTETAASSGEQVLPTGETRGDTVHIDVIDRWGNIVAATPSGGWLQSSPTIPALGFCLGTRLQMSWLDETSPSKLRPGRRPRTTLSPTLLSRDGVPFEALGTPGGDQQDQWQLLYLLRTLVGGHEPQQAIDAPTFHTTALAGSFWPRTWEPAGLVIEQRVGDDVLSELEARGHRITRVGDWSLGRMSTAGRDLTTGLLYAAANPRGAQGYAAGR